MGLVLLGLPSKLAKGCFDLAFARDFAGVDRGHGCIDGLQLLAGGDIVAAEVLWIRFGHAGTLADNARKHYGRAFVLPNASTCRPRRRRAMANSSTVSKASEIVVEAAAPWPPKRGTSAMHSARFITKASA